jgi:hypothetical protein
MTHSTLPESNMYKSPAYIILPTNKVVKDMMAAMSPHQFLYEEEENFTRVLDEVIQIISTRKDAELSLQYESISLVQDAMYSAEVGNVIEFTRFLVEFGMHLITHLEAAGVYKNGRMHYSYHGRIGNDIVLVQTFFEPQIESP